MRARACTASCRGRTQTMEPAYLIHFACFACRRSFKRKIEFGAAVYLKPCPDCSGQAIHLGRHFKAPKRTDQKQWRKVEYLVRAGFFFQHVQNANCRVPYPETLEDAREFVATYQSQAWSERLPEALQALSVADGAG
jgi:hypothetical protein